MSRGKMPVFRSIAAGYVFLFRNFWRILLLGWFPGLLIIILSTAAAIHAPSLSVTGLSSSEAFSVFGEWFGLWGLFGIGEILISIIFFVGLYRLYLEPNFKVPLIYFRFGEMEIRVALLSATIILMTLFSFLLFLFAGALVAAFVSQAMTSLSAADGENVTTLTKLTNVFSDTGTSLFWSYIGLCILVPLWVSLRFSFAVPAIIERYAVGLGFAWRITRGNAWQLFWFGFFMLISTVFIWLGYFVFASITLGVVLTVIYSRQAEQDAAAEQTTGTDAATAHSNQTPPATEGTVLSTTDIDKYISGLDLTDQVLFYGTASLGSFLLQLVIAAVFVGGTSYAYRRVAPKQQLK